MYRVFYLQFLTKILVCNIAVRLFEYIISHLNGRWFKFCMTKCVLFFLACSSVIFLIGYIARLYTIIPPQGTILKDVSGCIGVGVFCFYCLLFPLSMKCCFLSLSIVNFTPMVKRLAFLSTNPWPGFECHPVKW